MKLIWHGWLPLLLLVFCEFLPFQVHAQIDPVRRDLIQIGYNAALQGHAPLSAYAFLYHNEPEFLRTNLALRLAIAPTYLDSELGVRSALGSDTDLGIGLAGGGFADGYSEVRKGTFRPRESFIGHGGELSASVYHLFNPGSQIPLMGVGRVSGRYSTYLDDDTEPSFVLPEDRGTLAVRTGLRWGGREPTLYPRLGMGLSIWYEGLFRTGSGTYGYGDRSVEPESHLFWAEGLLAYTTERGHGFEVRLTLGTSIRADRFSAYRLGALLPLVSEFPLTLPGYYYQELSARDFVLLAGNYVVPLDERQRWNLNFTAATGWVHYLGGLEQPGQWHTGVGAGVLYRMGSWQAMVGYGYGVDAMRSSGRGAHSIGVLLQLDWGEAKARMFKPTSPNLWRGLQRVFGLFGS